LKRLVAICLGCMMWSSIHAQESLIWHLELPDGTTDSHEADQTVNPASVVKLATTLWALERLGPEHRFETRIGMNGTLDENGIFQGDLIVDGGGDPDFHSENAWLIAAELNRLGIHRISGHVLADDDFHFGWEGGKEKRITEANHRARTMARRLRDAFDPSRWGKSTATAWREYCKRHGIAANSPPRVLIDGKPGRAAIPAGTVTLRHYSNPIRLTLKRFNAWSNNDIERFGGALGSADELAEFVARKIEAPAGSIRFETLSGLGVNRMTPRQIVELLRQLDATCRRLGLELGDVLPAAGCGPGTLQSLGSLSDELAGRLVAKTGTLVKTDGGVVALAGRVLSEAGPAYFFVARPNSGHRVSSSRSQQVRWLRQRVDTSLPAIDCPVEPVLSDAQVQVSR